jgi:hypothetical protein
MIESINQSIQNQSPHPATTLVLSEEDAKHLGVDILYIVESFAVAAALEDATSNGSTLTMSEAIVDRQEPRMYVPEDAHIEVRNIPTLFNAKSGPSTRQPAHSKPYLSIHPMEPDKREFVINSVSDNDRDNAALVALRLEQSSMVPEYYVGFNRAEGSNKDTREDANMVTIVEKQKGGPIEASPSRKVSSLNPGDQYVIKNFNGLQDVDVVVKFTDLNNGDATILVTLTNAGGPPPPIPAPGSCKNFTIEVNTD